MKKKIYQAPRIIQLAFIHGLYYVLAGIWPILHMSGFTAVTGPKTDLWLVRTVGMLVMVIGAGLIAAALRKFVSLPLILIGAGAALGFVFVDVIYVTKNVISPIYLLDAAVEIILLVLWAALLYRAGRRETVGDSP